MIRSSNDREGLREKLAELIRAAHIETHAVEDAAASRLGVNRTDLRCLGTILERGPVSASKVADGVGLTRSAMTTALDRLERKRLIRRVRHPADRRGINVEATAAAKKALRDIREPIRLEGLALLEKYGDEDLQLLGRFLEEYCVLQQAHARRIRQRMRKGVR